MSGVEVKWHVVRHQVAIAGWVTDGETQKPIAGAVVTIESMTAKFKSTLELKSMQHGDRWKTMTERPDRTTTAPDGHFRFLDLPDGKYALGASLPRAGKRYGPGQGEATVSRDHTGRLRMAAVNIMLQPTTVKGKVTATGQKTGVVMAEVRVKGSGERTFSDVKGEYVLAGIEPGKRIVQVFAQGYKPAAEQAHLKTPGTSQTLNFALARATA